MLEKLKSRKVVVSLVILVVGTAADMLSKNGLSANLLTLLQFIAGAFVLGNGVEHVAETVKARSGSSATPAAPAVDLSSIEAELTGIRTQNATIIEANGLIQQGLTTILRMASGGPKQ